MLAASPNHYLRTEYLNPVQGNSVELDAKKSPLALLAQTCSQIGSDMPQKPQHTDKSKGKSSPGVKSPSLTSLSSDDNKSNGSFKPYDKKKEDDEGRVTPVRRSRNKSPDSARTHSRGSEGARTPSRTHEVLTTSAPTSKASSPSHFPKSVIPSLGDLTKDPLAAYKINPLYSTLPLGLDPLASAGLSSLTVKASTSGSLNNPYVGYARVKTVSGAETIIPLCRDPCCVGCQINTHALQIVNETCPPACGQCAQLAVNAKTLSSLPASLIPTIPTSSLISLYQPALLGNSAQPFPCNWMSGESPCGKRFPTTEELFQHFRSHASVPSSESSALHLPSLPHPFSHPLTRGYPTPPLSPSPLSPSRYHPYMKSSLSHLSPSAASAISAASLSALAPHPFSAYYNPYALYARSLSTTASLHH